MNTNYKFLVVVIVLAVFGLAVFAYGTNSLILLYGLIAFFPFVYFVNHREVSLMMIVAIYGSTLTLPQMPFQMSMSFAFSLMLIMMIFLGHIIDKRKVRWTTEKRWVVCFLLVMIITAMIRGFGLRVLGSKTWGGGSYVIYIGTCLFFILADEIVLDVSRWGRAVYSMCICSLVPVAAQALFAFSGGRLWQQFLFIAPDYQMIQFEEELASGSSMARLHVANSTSQYFFLLGLLLADGSPRSKKWVFVLIPLSFVFAGISGSRIPLIYNSVFLLFFLGLNFKKDLFSRFVNPHTLAILFCVVVLIMSSSFLPPTFQRGLSWLPFASVSSDVADDARVTIEWRTMVWEELFRQMPKYLLVGKGFAFTLSDLMTITARSRGFNSPEVVLAAHNYHQGVLHVIMDLGLAGLLCWSGLVISMSLRHWRIQKRVWVSPQLKHYHRAFFASFLAYVVAYFLISGGMNHVVTLLMWGVVMEGLIITDKKLPTMKTDLQVEQGTTWKNLRPIPRPAENILPPAAEKSRGKHLRY